jgi:hypothetical protein
MKWKICTPLDWINMLIIIINAIFKIITSIIIQYVINLYFLCTFCLPLWKPSFILFYLVSRNLMMCQMPLLMKEPKGWPMVWLMASYAIQLWLQCKCDMMSSFGHIQSRNLHGHMAAIRGKLELEYMFGHFIFTNNLYI